MNTPSAPAIFRSFLTAGILVMALTGARAQDNGVIWTPYGNLPAGVTPVNLSPSAPYTTNKFNKNTQTPTQAFDRNKRPYSAWPYSPFPLCRPGYPNVTVIPVFYGPADIYGPGYDGSGFYNGVGYGSYPPTVAATGAQPVSGASGPIIASTDPATTAHQVEAILQNADKNSTLSRETPTKQSSAPAAVGPPRVEETGRLSKQVKVRYDSEEGISFGWRGDASQITKLSVTLLARYGVSLLTRATNGAQAVTFAPGQNLVNTRHYKVEVVYTDGTTATYTAPLPFSVN